MEYILVMLAGALGLLFWEKAKRQSAEALLENTKVEKKLLEFEREKLENDLLLKSEEEKRAALKKQLEDNASDSTSF